MFEQIFVVFLILGTAVGVVVVGYTLYNAYKYRDQGEESLAAGKATRPTLGELPTGEGGGRKLFLSFGISAVIVVGLIAWTYGALLYVETGPEEQGTDENLDVEVVGLQFGWEFEYPDGHTERDELRVPTDRVVTLTFTSNDVWHTFGIPELRVKADAIPGQTTETWFIAEETGEYRAWCYELCGVGHSDMQADVIVMEPEEFEEWYDDPDAYEDADENGETDDGDGDTDETDAGDDAEGEGDDGDDVNENDETDDTNAVVMA